MEIAKKYTRIELVNLYRCKKISTCFYLKEINKLKI